MSRVTRCLLPLLCAGVPTLATAVEETENWYFGVHYNPMVELRDTETNVFNPRTAPVTGSPLDELFDIPSASLDNSIVEFDNGEGYGIVLGYDFRGIFRSELNVRQFENDYISRSEPDSASPFEVEGDLKSLSVMANFWMDFNRDGHLRPYIGLGVGGAEVTLDGEDDDNVLMAQAGVGVNWHMTKRWVLDLGYRYFDTDNPEFTSADDADFDFEYRGETLLLGLKYNFGFVEPEPAPIGDSDGDGVTDDRDRCPGTAPGATVNADGCADSDGDGVIDSRDLCPNTPPGTPVTENGCSDSDGDGIIDSADACPNSPAGQPVLNNGCGASQSTILQGVNFQLNKAELTSSAQRILEDVAAALLDSPGFRIELQGHTDSLGSEEYNRDLSQRRADSVKGFLVDRGIEADRLIAKGYGELAPVADNSTAEGRAMNRRVELMVIEVE